MQPKATLPGKLRLVLGATLAASTLSVGAANATVTCSFADAAAGTCLLSEGNLSLTNFAYSGDGVEGTDSITLQATDPTNVIISFLATGGLGSFDSKADLSFDLTALNGYTLLEASANSTMAPSTPFVFNYRTSSLTTNPLTTSGSPTAYDPFIGAPTAAQFLLDWDAGNNLAQSTALYTRLAPPAPPVPGPLPLAGAASAFFSARSLRKRIKSSSC